MVFSKLANPFFGVKTEWGKSMDIGVDNAYRLFGEYRPFSLDEIKKIMDDREHKMFHH